MTFIPEAWIATKPGARGSAGAVSSQHPLATELGLDVLSRGGNAVDAAVSIGMAMGCLEPWMSGLGGGGYMMVYLAREDRTYCLDFGMVAPLGVDPADYPLLEGHSSDMFVWPSVLEDRNIVGPHSIAVPGHVAGMDAALRRFGTFTWAQSLQPAIEMAQQGMLADWFATVMIASEARHLVKNDMAARTYLPDGLPPTTDFRGQPTRLRLGHLEATLRRLAAAGADDYYRGELARSIVSDAAEIGSRLSAEDLARYEVQVSEAGRFGYRDSVVRFPIGLNAGPTLQHSLQLLERHLKPGGQPDPDAYMAYANVLQEAYQHRLANMGDCDESRGPSCTTHLNVVDKDGNVVALTQTLLSTFGSRVMLPTSGILMNNGMMWFDPRPDRPNSIRPGQRPLSNMCPVILERPEVGGIGRLAIGASGGRRIFPSVMQIVSFLVDYGMSEEESLALARIDCNGGETFTVDAALPSDVLLALQARFNIRPVPNGLYPPQFATPSLAGHNVSPYRSVAAAHPHSPWASAGSQT